MISAINFEHLYQCNVVPLKIIPSNVNGPITLNKGMERMNKCHFKTREIYDYVIWTTKLILMMQRGFELILQF